MGTAQDGGRKSNNAKSVDRNGVSQKIKIGNNRGGGNRTAPSRAPDESDMITETTRVEK